MVDILDPGGVTGLFDIVHDLPLIQAGNVPDWIDIVIQVACQHFRQRRLLSLYFRLQRRISLWGRVNLHSGRQVLAGFGRIWFWLGTG